MICHGRDGGLALASLPCGAPMRRQVVARGSAARSAARGLRWILVDLVVQASLVAEQMLAGSWEKLTVIYNRYVNMVTYLQAQSTVYSPKVFNGALKIGLESSYELEGPRPAPPRPTPPRPTPPRPTPPRSAG